MHIFAVADNNSPCHWHRTFLPFRYLSKDHSQHSWHIEQEQTPEPFDLFWLYGCVPFGSLPEVLRLKREGVKILWTLDDLYWDFPKWRVRKPSDEQLATIQLMPTIADWCVYSTPELRRQMGGGAVCPNLIEVNSYRVSEPATDQGPVRIAWAGASGHSGDLAVVDEACCAVRKHFGDRVEFHFVGAGPSKLVRDWVGNGVFVHPMVKLADYPHLMRQIRPHLTLAPLADCAFNACKSNIRILEGWALAAAVLASPVGGPDPAPASGSAAHSSAAAGAPPSWRG